MFPTRVRDFSVGYLQFISRICGFLSNVFVVTLFEYSTNWIFYLNVVISVSGLVFTLLLPFDTYERGLLDKSIDVEQKEKEEERSRYDYERLTNQTKDMLIEKGLPGALANMVMAGAEGEAEMIQKNIVALQEYVNQAIDAGVEARIKASSGTPKSLKTSKGITLEEIKSMTPTEINARWDEIKKSMRN